MTRDTISGVVLNTWYVNYPESVSEEFSFKFLRRELGISSGDLSLNILNRDLWSTAMIRSLHPNTEYRALSVTSSNASASPLYRCITGFRRVSEPTVNECDLPSFVTATLLCSWAVAMFLKTARNEYSESHGMSASLINILIPSLNLTSDCSFRLLKEVVEVFIPNERGSGLQQL